MQRLWITVSPQDPCPICGKPDWCAGSVDGVWALCRRSDTGEGIYRVDKAGGEFWLYRIGTRASSLRTANELPSLPQASRAEPIVLDRAYRALLALLSLSATHRQALRQRGLVDAEILRRHYRTLPLTGRAALAKRLVAQYGAELCAQVPGLYQAERNGQHCWSMAGAEGLLIPVRDLHGHIIALKVRADATGEGPKYTYLSSTKYGGPGPGTQAHIPMHTDIYSNKIRVTEGELKADVATALSGMLTIAVPGVALWQVALPVLQVLGKSQVLVAFDTDWRTNPQVAQALSQAVYKLMQAGYEVEIEDWDPALGKGIDDLLATGQTPTRRSTSLALGAGMRGHATQWTGTLATQLAAEVPSWH